jgi:hypothetical protein
VALVDEVAGREPCFHAEIREEAPRHRGSRGA